MKERFLKVLTKAKVFSLSEQNESALIKLNKNPLVKIISLVQDFGGKIRFLKSAAEKVDELKSEQIGLQNRLLKLQIKHI